MRFIVKLLSWLVIFALGVIAGFMMSPIKRGVGSVGSINYYPSKNCNEPVEEEELGI